MNSDLIGTERGEKTGHVIYDTGRLGIRFQLIFY